MKKFISILLISISILTLFCGCGDTGKIGIHHAEIEIENYGTVKLELDGDMAPITVQNFMDLANSGFYDGLTFHRKQDGFVLQGGDPKGNGTGNSGKTIKGEFSLNGVDNTISHKRGVISMARSSNGYDTASCQFFICHGDAYSLDGQYAAFGRVTEGMDIIDKICEDLPDSDRLPANKQPKIVTIRIVD